MPIFRVGPVGMARRRDRRAGAQRVNWLAQSAIALLLRVEVLERGAGIGGGGDRGQGLRLDRPRSAARRSDGEIRAGTMRAPLACIA